MSRSDDDDALIVTLDPKGQREECVSVSDLASGERRGQLFALVCLQAPETILSRASGRW